MVIRVSWSQLRTHEECKQKRYLHVQKSGMAAKNQRLFLPGNVTDRVVRNWLQNAPMDHIGEMPSMVEPMLDSFRTEILDRGERTVWKGLGDRAQIVRDCVEAVTKIEPALLKYVVPYNFIADFKFAAPLTLPKFDGTQETILLIGYMDIIVKDNQGRYWVFDVKQTRDNQYWRKTVGQLTFYDLAVQLIFQKKTMRTGLFQPLCTTPVLPYEVTDDLRSQMNQRVVGLVNDIWRGDKTPRKDTKYCGFCDVKNACEKYQPVFIDGKKRVSF